MSHTLARRFAIAALSLPLLLAGCADDEPVPKVPEPTAAPTSVASTSAPPEPVEPTLPPEAEGKGIKAAEAFVRHYYAMVNYAQATGDTKGLSGLGALGCDACKGGVEGLDSIYRQGGTVEGGETTVERAKVTGIRKIPGAGEIYYLAVRVSSSDQTVSGSKELDGTYPASVLSQRFEVARTAVGFEVMKWYAE